jgi:hypothetical protein
MLRVLRVLRVVETVIPGAKNIPAKKILPDSVREGAGLPALPAIPAKERLFGFEDDPEERAAI